MENGYPQHQPWPSYFVKSSRGIEIWVLDYFIGLKTVSRGSQQYVHSFTAKLIGYFKNNKTFLKVLKIGSL